MGWQTEQDAGFEILDKLQLISDVAKQKITDPGVLIPAEDFNHPLASRNARRELTRKSEEFRQLSKEPLVVALLAETEDGERRVYYFARRAQVDGIARYFTHSMSPIGHLATYEPGDEYDLPNGQTLTVVSKFVLTPQQLSGKWDSRPAQVFWAEEPPKSLASLLDHLNFEQTELDGWEALEGKLEAQPTPARNALRGTGLRDQAVLDKIQDEIFRLPISSQLMISGPPGSGKTTTLIRRMAQKNEMSFLTPEEQAVVQRAASADRHHAESWIMFTPTELLEGYLSEAFNREGVPAPKDRVWTWSQFSMDFGREEARLLRKSNNRSGFFLDEQAFHLAPKVHAAPTEWINRFEEWLSEEHMKELRRASDRLQSSQLTEVLSLSTRIGGITKGDRAARIFSVLEELSTFGVEIEQIRGSLRAKWRDFLDRRIERFGRLDSSNISKLDSLVKDIEKASNSAVNEEDLDEEDDLELEGRPTSRTRKDRIFGVIRQAVNSQARSLHGKRKPPRRYDALISFLGEEVLNGEQLSDLGRDLDVLSGASRIGRACTIYFSSLGARYRAFRRQEPEWYKEEVASEKVDRDEFDALILAKLKAVRALLPRVDTDLQFWSSLRPFEEKLRNQVYVDEATDFSEIQLSAMYHLSHPQVRSFFMSGDFDQRLTEWGIKDHAALQRAVPGISTRDVEIGYRQSRRLKDFVDLMRRRWLGAEPNSGAPRFGLHDGFEPAMFEAKGDLDVQAGWIADRIQEIDRLNERLPSVAVLVPRAEDVKPMAKRLEALLDSIPVSAHEEAGNLGRDEEVRVFPVHHVKGLEFEAAFFVGVDQLRHDVPELFQRYLYVGSTRAATFLGFAANNKMPSEIMDLRDSFVSVWEN